jgi:pyruvate/2-oxoglutarate dehydrogenase complex dihydrolipoamide acyltransferase (E2) component
MAKEKIQLPAMSDQMTEAEILSWKVDVGSRGRYSECWRHNR